MTDTVPPARLLKAVITVVRAYRAMKNPDRDRTEPAQKKRWAALRGALEELDAAAVAYKPPRAASPGFDWTGAGKAVAAGLRLLQKLQGAKTTREVADVIEGEIVE